MEPDLMPAETLRKAAALMREKASEASDGPWKSWVEGRDHWGGDSMIGTADDAGGDVYVRVGEGYHPRWEADQDYIASMHPLIGLALADLLDDSAAYYEGLSADEAAFVASALGGDVDPGLKLARIFLGEGSDA